MDGIKLLDTVGIKGWTAIAVILAAIIGWNSFVSKQDFESNREENRKKNAEILIEAIEAFRVTEERIHALEEKQRLKPRNKVALYTGLLSLHKQYADTKDVASSDFQQAKTDRKPSSPLPPSDHPTFQEQITEREYASLASTEPRAIEASLTGRNGSNELDFLYTVLFFLVSILGTAILYQSYRARSLESQLNILMAEKSLSNKAWELTHRNQKITNPFKIVG